VSIDDALSLAAIHKRHDWCLKMLVEDRKEYARALDYMADLEFDCAELYMKKYGHTLIQHEPEIATNYLKREIILILNLFDYENRGSGFKSR
jgi:vacuolar protein sorting-associated protein 11